MSDQETLESTQETENQTSEDIQEEEEDITAEQLERMSDEEFEAFMNKGIQTTSSKPEEKEDEPKEEEKQEDTEEVKDTDNNKEEKKEETKTEVTEQTIDYKNIYDQVFKPFKANGKEITPRNVDDVVKLMQMGANYTKKMQLMAPMRKAVETLNKADIGEKELNFLIDLYKGNKDAIKVFLKDKKIDPLELNLDEEEDTKYTPKNYMASDDDVEFADTLLDVNDSLPKIREIVDKVWDSKSKTLLMKDPNLMRALHEEIQLGRFDEVQKRVEEEKTFGRYKGIPDIQAYIDVVTKMTQQQVEETSKPIDKVKTVTNTPDTKSTKSIPDKSKAAPTKGKVKTNKSNLTANDIFSMSEEDFNKLDLKDIV